MKKSRLFSALILSASLACGTVLAGDIDPAKVPDIKKTEAQLYLSPKEVFEMKKSGGDKVLLVDVRTGAELEYVGAADIIDAHIPYTIDDPTSWDDKRKAYKKDANSNFMTKIEEWAEKKSIGKDDTIILMCRSGDRSAKAADLMAKAGYTKVYSAVEGFEGDKAKDGENKGKRTVNGWKNAGLPWGYDLVKEKMYFE
ncbi:MAG: rhodanese-like domain-containing protein [Halothiobacillaceae bacterium]|nr:rhodanese-like domain-containing protein [Halothiobacillaceae bacterium]